MAGYFPRQEFKDLGLSERAVRVLEQLSDFVDTVNRVTATEGAVTAVQDSVDAVAEDVENQALSLTSLDGRIDVFEDFSATDPRYVKKAGDSMSGALDVQALLQCDSFRIDAAPTVAAAIASTHKLAINCSGVTYYLMLSNV